MAKKNDNKTKSLAAASITNKRGAFILTHMIGLNGTAGAPVFWIGSPGGGKTTLAKEVAEAYLDGNRMTLEGSRIQGPDLNMPIPNHNDKTVAFYTAKALKDLASKERGLFFADELPRSSDQGVLAACLNIFLDHEIGDASFKHIHCWAAGNPVAQVGGIEPDPAFANRVVIFPWTESEDSRETVTEFADHVMSCDPFTGRRDVKNAWPAVKDWRATWPAALEKARGLVINFLRSRTDMLVEECPTEFRPWRSKRSWTLASHVLASCLNHEATDSETRALVSYTVGPEGAAAFMDFLRDYKLPNPRDVISGAHRLKGMSPNDLFLAAFQATDVMIADWNKANTKPVEAAKTFYKNLEEACDSNVEVIANVAQRLLAANIFDMTGGKDSWSYNTISKTGTLRYTE